MFLLAYSHCPWLTAYSSIGFVSQLQVSIQNKMTTSYCNEKHPPHCQHGPKFSGFYQCRPPLYFLCHGVKAQSSGRDQKLLKVHDFILFRHLHDWTWLSTALRIDPCTCAHKCKKLHARVKAVVLFPPTALWFVFLSGHGQRQSVALTALWRGHTSAHVYVLRVHTFVCTYIRIGLMSAMMDYWCQTSCRLVIRRVLCFC